MAAVLLTLMKAIGCFLVLSAAASVLVILLPVKLIAWGEVRLEGPWEDVLDGQGQHHVRVGFLASVLGGAIAVSYRNSQISVSALGARVWMRRAQPKEERESLPEDGAGRDLPRSSQEETSSSRGPKKVVAFGENRDRMRLFLAPNVRRKTMVFLKRCVSALHPQVDADVLYGTGDPSVVGMIYGAYVVSAEIIGLNGLHLHPNFVEEVLDIKVTVGLQFLPVVLIWHVGAFLLCPTIRPLWWKMWRKKSRDPRLSRA
ncbi:MAG: hypothetical protein ACOX3V_08790 [Bacillota bacterium]